MDGIPPAQEDGEESIPEENEQENPSGTEEQVFSVEVITEDGAGVLDFGILPVGETADGTTKNVTVRNTGTETLHFWKIPRNILQCRTFMIPLSREQR